MFSSRRKNAVSNATRTRSVVTRSLLRTNRTCAISNKSLKPLTVSRKTPRATVEPIVNGEQGRRALFPFRPPLPSPATPPHPRSIVRYRTRFLARRTTPNFIRDLHATAGTRALSITISALASDKSHARRSPPPGQSARARFALVVQRRRTRAYVTQGTRNRRVRTAFEQTVFPRPSAHDYARAARAAESKFPELSPTPRQVAAAGSPRRRAEEPRSPPQDNGRALAQIPGALRALSAPRMRISTADIFN